MAKSTKKTAKASRSRTGAKPAPSRATVKKQTKKKTARPAASRSKKTAGKSVKKASRASAKTNKKTTKARGGVRSAQPEFVKNQAGLGQRDLQHFMDLLLAKRGDLVGDMSAMEREALRTGGGSNLSNTPIHMADMGTDNYEQEFTLGLMEKDRQMLREINAALNKMQDGSYGICEGTGKPIAKARLEAQPWARYSIEYARQLEKRSGHA